MSKKKFAFRAAKIKAATDILINALAGRLEAAGIGYRIIPKATGTGTVYVSIRVCDPVGIGLKNAGARVRVSDHRKPGDRWTNFSRPAQRFFGVWCFARSHKIERKAERIVGGIVRRYDALQPIRTPHTHWTGQSVAKAARPQAPNWAAMKGGEI